MITYGSISLQSEREMLTWNWFEVRRRHTCPSLLKNLAGD